MEQPRTLVAWMESIVEECKRNAPGNTLDDQMNERAFEEPQVGYSRQGGLASSRA